MSEGLAEKSRHVRSGVSLAASIVSLTFSVTAFSASNASYTYDALGRLTTVVYVDGAKRTVINYGYDAAGNRTSTSTVPSS
ncbi:RHS repeat domain-containing protein [Paraburkholderia gardini]|uniref:RHS repeat domain-containing protein n=1 Tax=Paraburkholderia gardini TaxID=2823469 RepID=UPI001E4A7673|nr:RHS repeat domain-containing protein [Paraburkholderia gardini]